MRFMGGTAIASRSTGGIVVKTILVNNISYKSQCLLHAKGAVSSSNL